MSRTLPKPCLLLLLLISILLVGCQEAIPPSSAPNHPGISLSLPDDRPDAPAVTRQAGTLAGTAVAAPKQDADLTLQLADSLMNVFETFTGRR